MLTCLEKLSNARSLVLFSRLRPSCILSARHFLRWRISNFLEAGVNVQCGGVLTEFLNLRTFNFLLHWQTKVYYSALFVICDIDADFKYIYKMIALSRQKT